MNRLLSHLASLRLTLGLLLTLALVAGLGSFLPRSLGAAGSGAPAPLFGPFLLALGFDHFYTGPLYRGLLVLFTANLLACATGRSVKGWQDARGRGTPGVRVPTAGRDWEPVLRGRGFRVTRPSPLRALRRPWAFLGFPLVHLAPPLILAGGLWGTWGGFVATQNVYVGDLTPTAYDWSARGDRSLPWVLAVEDLQLHHYPVQLRLQVLDAGEPRVVEVRVGTAFAVPGSSYRVRVSGFDAATGDLSYVVSGPDGEHGPFSRGREEGAPLRVRPLAFRDPEVRQAEALVSLRDARGQTLVRQIVAVNQPLVRDGVRIYLTAWSSDPEGRPFVGFQFVRDPGQPLVWAASLSLCLGLLLALFGDGAWVREEDGQLLCRASRGTTRARELLAPAPPLDGA